MLAIVELRVLLFLLCLLIFSLYSTVYTFVYLWVINIIIIIIVLLQPWSYFVVFVFVFLLGIPKQKRGEAWKLLIDYNINYPEQRLNLPYGQYSITSLPQENVPYEDLICQLTSFQHLILIDLSRTFPKYSYYSTFMGPGQLALYNLLKAYSLLDTEVGYCQGLSFIAGVILLHVSFVFSLYSLFCFEIYTIN